MEVTAKSQYGILYRKFIKATGYKKYCSGDLSEANAKSGIVYLGLGKYLCYLEILQCD